MLILCTDSLKGYGLNRIFKFAKDAGYEGIDLALDPKQYDSLNPEYVSELIDQYDLPVVTVSSYRTSNKKKIAEFVKFAKDIAANVVVLQPPKTLEFSFTKWLKKEIPRLRQKEDISIAMENSPAGSYFGIIPEYGLADKEDLKNFKHIALDTARIGEKHQDLIRHYTYLKKYIVLVHLSNFHKGKKYSKPQDGILPLESLLTKMKQDGYAGAVSIKVLPKHLHAGNDSDLVDELKKIKKYYDKYYTAIETIESND